MSLLSRGPLLLLCPLVVRVVPIVELHMRKGSRSLNLTKVTWLFVSEQYPLPHCFSITRFITNGNGHWFLNFLCTKHLTISNHPLIF